MVSSFDLKHTFPSRYDDNSFVRLLKNVYIKLCMTGYSTSATTVTIPAPSTTLSVDAIESVTTVTSVATIQSTPRKGEGKK